MSRQKQSGVKTRVSNSDIVASLRQQIVSGKLGPGSKIPTRVVLEKTFRASPLTVQHALDRLSQEGFVEAMGRKGTFVTNHPPHLCHYAMVFTCSPSRVGWTRFYQVLVNEASRYDGSSVEPRRISIHFGVENHEENRELRVLEASLRNQSLAGVIFPQHPGATGLLYSALGQDGKIPRVAFGSIPRSGSEAKPFAHLSTVGFGSYEPKALDYLLSQGRKNIAVISNPRPGTYRHNLLKNIADRGMRILPYWLQMVDLSHPECARELTHLMMNRDQTQRPDGLFIADDNLVEHSVLGLLDAGVRVPDELTVVGHCNFPWPVPHMLPVKRMGYDAGMLLTNCMEVLEEARRAGQACHKTVDAIFEEDLHG